MDDAGRREADVQNEGGTAVEAVAASPTRTRHFVTADAAAVRARIQSRIFLTYHLRVSLQPLPARVRVFDVEGVRVRCVESDDGERTWLCGCASFHNRSARFPEGFCGHVVVAIGRCIGDRLIEVGL